MSQPVRIALEREGYALLPALFDKGCVEHFRKLFTERDLARSKRRSETFGARNLLVVPEIGAIARSNTLIMILDPLLGTDFRVVRGLFFDKTVGANWPVLWHQDLSLALKQKREIDGWPLWTIKRDVVHAQAPASVLRHMITARIHLDDCGSDNGALKVIPGSHGNQLSRKEIAARTTATHAVIEAKAGDVLLMKPLLLHSSSAATTPSHRRVVHFEFAPADVLPTPLEWAFAA